MWRELACGELERPHASRWEEDDDWNNLNLEHNL